MTKRDSRAEARVEAVQPRAPSLLAYAGAAMVSACVLALLLSSLI